MAKGIFDLILDSIFDADWIGRRGEKLTERELNLVKLFGRNGKTLRNVYIPKDNGETSEIDVLFITQKGIFVFESKNYSGWIFGDEKSYNWTVMLPNKMKNKFYNPIKQNSTHVKWLSNYLGDATPLFSIIVFSERCELKKITVESDSVRVIKRDRIYATVRTIWNEKPDVLNEEQIEKIYGKLQSLTNVAEVVKRQHIDSINKKFSKDEKVISEENNSEQSAEEICPKCGNPLVLRVAKRGENAGNKFLGCSQFPKCKYIQQIDNNEKI